MKAATKAILISAAIVFTSIAVVLMFFFVYLPGLYTPENMQAQWDAGFVQGQSFGRTTNQQGCFVEAADRAKTRVLNAADGPPWLAGCLDVSETSEGFCDGILPPSEHPDFDQQKSALRRAQDRRILSVFHAHRLTILPSLIRGHHFRRHARTPRS